MGRKGKAFIKAKAGTLVTRGLAGGACCPCDSQGGSSRGHTAGRATLGSPGSGRREAPGRANTPNASRFKVGARWSQLGLICQLDPWTEPSFETQRPGRGRESRACGVTGASGTTAGGGRRPAGLGLEVLVDLGDVLHDALPVRPVCVQHLAELLREEGRGHGRHAPRPGLRCQTPTRGAAGAGSTQAVGNVVGEKKSVFFLLRTPSLLKTWA